MGRREEKKDATRQQILSAATELFPVKGFEATSIDDIVEKANVVKGTFYYHFKSKDELLLALRQSSLAASAKHVTQSLANGTSPLSILFELFGERASWTEQNPEMARVFFMHRLSQLLVNDRLENHFAPGSFPALIADVVSAGQLQGELRTDINHQELSRIMLSLFVQSQIAWLSGDRSRSSQATVEQWLSMLLEGALQRND
jgi:AcrR family transcriptional regulator